MRQGISAPRARWASPPEWLLSGLATSAVAALIAAGGPANAQTALHQYPGADLALGAKLLGEQKCQACHVSKVGGDGSAIYKPKGRINTPSALLSMVERCSNELNLGLFPEDSLAIAAVLQRDHYRFAASKP